MKQLILSISTALFLYLAMPVAIFAESPDQEQEEEFLTGRELLQGCEEGAAPGTPNQYCMQYVFGYVQTVVSLQAADPSQPQLFCIDPTQIGLPEVTDQVSKWLSSHSERLDEEAYVLVGQSLAEYYPCQASAF